MPQASVDDDGANATLALQEENMFRTAKSFIPALALSALALPAVAEPQGDGRISPRAERMQEKQEERREAAEKRREAKDVIAHVRDWPEASRDAARSMVESYGEPDEVTDTRLIWHDNGRWVRTIVYKEPVEHNFPMPHQDVLEQTIHFDVPPDRMDELARYDGSVIVDRTRGELSAHCDAEAMNILALNLAVDVARGDKNVEEARETYARNAIAYKQDRRPTLTTELTFDLLKEEDTGFADRPARQVMRQMRQEQQRQR